MDSVGLLFKAPCLKIFGYLRQKHRTAMDKKRTYRIKNWSDYNKSLIQRGDITLWCSDDAVQSWVLPNEGKRGRPTIYSDEAILCALMIKVVYRLPLRALEGFLVSLLGLLGVLLPVPSYTQISRRAISLGQIIERLSSKKGITDIVIDSSGLKVYGEGEWKVRQHGKSKRRTWRKIHLGFCSDSHEVVLSLLTENSVSDGEVAEKIAENMPPTVRRGYGDGAYDKSSCYKKFQELSIDWITPPQRGAILHDLSREPWMEQRNDAIRAITGLGNDEEARSLWKKLKGYHRRSLAETGIYRFKTIFGSDLKARDMRRQRAEVHAKALAMNRMTGLGMPKGVWVS